MVPSRIMRRILSSLAVIAAAVCLPTASAQAAADSADSGDAGDPAVAAAAAVRVSADSAVARSAAAVAARPGTPIRWWHAAAVAGGTALIVLTLDQPVRDAAQAMRSGGTDAVADVLRQGGWAPVYFGVPAVLTGVGLLAKDDALARTGGRMLASVAVAVVATQGAKRVLGRRRPFTEQGAQAFDLFAFDDAALPSGHATGAFALAAAAALEVNRPWLGATFYALAAGTGWSRINDDQHWLGDTVLGAAIGITSAHLVSGRWRLFHLHPPAILAAPDGTPALGFSVAFRGPS
jgi:membrane-associated phospholipid phosphatase